jgi:hypothetical protein
MEEPSKTMIINRIFVCLWGGITAPKTHESDSSERPKLEDTTNPTTHGDWRLYVQN